MIKIAGSGSISQRHGSADPDSDLHTKMSWIRNTASLFSKKIIWVATVVNVTDSDSDSEVSEVITAEAETGRVSILFAASNVQCRLR
jgi:hypothetical protein